MIPATIIVIAVAVKAVITHDKVRFTIENLWLRPLFPQDELLAALTILPLSFVGMSFFAAGEELGWRGFAMPRLISSMGFLPAVLFLGVAWSVWHFPLALTDGNPLHGENLLMFMASDVLLCFLLGYLWVRTGSSLLATLFHAAENVVFFVLQPTATTGYRTASTLLFVLVIGFFWRPALFNRRQTGMPVAPSSTSARSAQT